MNAGASGKVKGYLGVHHNSYYGGSGSNHRQEAAWVQFGNNITGTTQADVTELIPYDCVTEWCFAFKFSITAPNVVQKNWNTKTDGASIGVATGILEIEFGSGLKYLVLPKRCYAFYGGSANNNVYVFLTCNPPRTQ